MTDVKQASPFLLVRTPVATTGDLTTSNLNLPAVIPSGPVELLKDSVPVAVALTAVGGLTAMALLAPSELTLAGGALLSAAATGVAAIYLRGARTTRTASLAAFAGIAGIAALTTIGAVGSVHKGKAELALSRSALQTEVVSIAAERGALAKERIALANQRAQVTTQLGTVQTQLSGLTTDRKSLSEDRAAFDLRVREAAERLAAPEKQALAAATAALEAERKGFVDARSAELSAEAKQLTSAQLKAIENAVVKHNKQYPNHVTLRIVGDVHPGSGPVSANHRTIPPDSVVATLVAKGHVVAGPVTDRGDLYVVQAPGAITITSVGKLLEYLRLSTGADLSGLR